MSSSGLGLPAIEKLQGSINYNTWKFDVELILVHDDLWKYVESTPAAEDAAAKRDDQRARTKICLLIENQCKVHVRKATTAYETWKNLKTAYEDKGINNRCRLLSRLVGLKLNMFNSITEYVTEIMQTANHLSDLGKEIDDELLAALMLQGLPEEYAPMRLAFESANTVLTTDYIKTKLLQLDNTRACASSSTSAPSSALTTTKHHRKFVQRNKEKKAVKCFICEGPHKACDCPQNPRKSKTNHMATALTTTNQEKNQRDDWILDSGASGHMSHRKDWMSNFVKVDKKVEVSCANGGKVYGEGFGIVESESPKINVGNVMYVPQLSSNLLSVSCMVNTKDKVVVFSRKGCEIYNADECTIKGKPCVTGVLDRGIYKLKCSSQATSQALASTTEMRNEMELWHKRMAHLGIRNLILLRDKLATGVSFPNIINSKLDCVACLMGKQTRQPFERNKANRARELLELVHSDLSGPMSDNSMGGYRYYITFIDDFSRKTFVYFLKAKSETFEKIQEFKSFAETQTGKKLKVLRTDNGGEFVNKRVNEFLRDHGIKHQLTIAYTPEQNGVAERANRTIAEKVRAMLQEAGLPVKFWAEATNTAIYLKNRSPTIAVRNKTPEEVWTGRKTDLSHLKVFGCKVYMHIPDQKRTKWDPKSKELIFVGYCEESKGYRLIDPSNGELHRARDVVFFEDQLYHGATNSKKQQDHVTISLGHDVQEIQPQIEENILRQQEQRQSIQDEQRVLEEILEPDDGDHEQRVQEENHESDDGDHVDANPDVAEAEEEDWTLCEERPEEVHIEPVVEERRYPRRERKAVQLPDFITYQAISEQDDPLTVPEALARKDAKQWRDAIQEELDALKKNGTWILVKPDQASNVVDSKWLFRIKKEAGNKTRYKARLVARGFSQRKGIDYDETFSPVVRHSSLRLLIALAANLGLKIEHMDVKTAFLNGNLNEKVFMRQPPHFEEKGKEDYVCLIQKSLYGLKQAPRSWNMKLHTELESLNFKRCKNEPCVYIRRTNKDTTILAIYVDDILIFHNNDKEVAKVKRELMSKFEMKDLGRAELFLGLRIKQEQNSITIDQEDYIDKVLRRFNMENCKPVSTPGVPGQRFEKPQEPYTADAKIPYRELIGSLMYITVCSRPDIAHSVNFMSQFCNCYTEVHWAATKRILRYLKGTKDMCLRYKKDTYKNIQGFADADHGGNIVDRKSYSGNVFVLAKGAISWQSTKQKSIALSTAEAEYMSLSEAAKEAIFLKRFQMEIMGKEEPPIVIHTDSQSAMAIAQNPVHHQRTKHVDVRYQFIRETVENGEVMLKYLDTKQMVADALTKAVATGKHEFCRREMGVC